MLCATLPAALQTLREKAEPITVSPKKFYDVASASPENEHMPRQWLFLKRALHLSTEPIKPSAHVGRSSNDPDPGSLREFDHRINLSMTAATSARSTPASMLTIALPGNSI
jgi:hypothetical protein